MSACDGSGNTAKPEQVLSSDTLSEDLSGYDELKNSQLSAQAQYLWQALNNAPYAALVKINHVDVIDLPDADASDDYSEQKLIHHAEVLQTFKGNISKGIVYTMYVETGDTLNYPQEPFIITLCESKDGFYWPGVGANFSADKHLISLAQKYANQFNNKQNTLTELSNAVSLSSKNSRYCQPNN